MNKRITFDTNIFLHNIGILIDPKYDDYEKVSIIPVIAELDNIKVNSSRSDLKFKGRVATGKLIEYVEKGIFKPLVIKEVEDCLALNKYELMDDLIISICKTENIKLLTMDYNVYLKCMHLGVETELVKSETKIENLSMVYKGKKPPIYVPKSIIDKVYSNGYVGVEDVNPEVEFNPNECTTLIDYSNQSCVVRVKYIDGRFEKIKYTEKSEFWGLKAISEEQKFALGLLNDDSIRIITLTGVAGSSKTILSFAVGLEKKVNNFGNGKLYIARPPVPLSRKLQLGFKKGTTMDKAIGSLGSYSTNLERLSQLKGEKRKIDGTKMLMELLEQCEVNYLNIEDVLGMSFGDDDYIIVDEAELLTKDEMKAILTRGGKMVVIGDCEQNSENSGVDYDNSGLLHLIEVGKKSNLIAHLTMEEVYRSEMVKEISQIW